MSNLTQINRLITGTARGLGLAAPTSSESVLATIIYRTNMQRSASDSALKTGDLLVVTEARGAIRELYALRHTIDPHKIIKTAAGPACSWCGQGIGWLAPDEPPCRCIIPTVQDGGQPEDGR